MGSGMLHLRAFHLWMFHLDSEVGTLEVLTSGCYTFWTFHLRDVSPSGCYTFGCFTFGCFTFGCFTFGCFAFGCFTFGMFHLRDLLIQLSKKLCLNHPSKMANILRKKFETFSNYKREQRLKS